jgi:hypothetical protein
MSRAAGSVLTTRRRGAGRPAQPGGHGGRHSGRRPWLRSWMTPMVAAPGSQRWRTNWWGGRRVARLFRPRLGPLMSSGFSAATRPAWRSPSTRRIGPERHVPSRAAGRAHAPHSAEGQVVVRGDDREGAGLRVVPQVGVVAGPVDVVGVADQLLEREVGGERLHIQVVVEVGDERLVVGAVDEVEELDQRLLVLLVLVGLLVEDVVVGQRPLPSARVMSS